MRFSIIIPAHNEEKYLEATLNSIKEQTFQDHEVIVVCNACTDNSEEEAKKGADFIYNVEQKGVSFARNFGAEKAKGDVLAFLDADTVLSKDVLKDIDEKFKDEKVAVATCRNFTLHEKFMSRLFMMFKNAFLWNNWSSGIIFCRKEVFEKGVKFNNLLDKHETREFIKGVRNHGEYKISKEIVNSSMRRFEKLGYLNTVWYWVSDIFNPKKEYRDVK